MENNATLSLGTSGLAARPMAQGLPLRHATSLILKQLRRMAATCAVPVEKLRDYYSSVCGRTLTTRQTLLLVNTQAAFLAVALPADIHVALRLACCAWLAVSLMWCKRAI